MKGGIEVFKAKLTSKGQITIPAPVREALQLKPGERVAFFPGANGEFRLRRVGSIKDMYGCLSDLSGPDLPKINAELDNLMAEIAAEEDEASKSEAQQNPDSEAA